MRVGGVSGGATAPPRSAAPAVGASLASAGSMPGGLHRAYAIYTRRSLVSFGSRSASTPPVRAIPTPQAQATWLRGETGSRHAPGSATTSRFATIRAGRRISSASRRQRQFHVKRERAAGLWRHQALVPRACPAALLSPLARAHLVRAALRRLRRPVARRPPSPAPQDAIPRQ